MAEQRAFNPKTAGPNPVRLMEVRNMTNTYPKNASMEEKTYEELRCIRCVLERILNAMDSSGFVDYEFEKFGKVKK